MNNHKGPINRLLERHVPEQRIYIRSNRTTRYVRLSPVQQTMLVTGIAISLCWLIVASVTLGLNAISAKSYEDQNTALQKAYEKRLVQLAAERDQRAIEAQTTQQHYYAALRQVSDQQEGFLALEEERRELGRGLKIMQRKLQEAVKARDEAQIRADTLLSDLNHLNSNLNAQIGNINDTRNTLEFLSTALADISDERDQLSTDKQKITERAEALEFDTALLEERGDLIFQRLESAVGVALEPLERALDKKGVNSEALIQEIKRGYSGTGGPITPLEITSETALIDSMSNRASNLLADLDRVNLMKLAADQLPLGHPVRGRYRYTSGFGDRRDPVSGGWRMHNGADMAGPMNTKIVAPGDGVVTFAGRQSGYGKLIKIRHAQGFETFFAHLNRIDVKPGDRVSKGDLIGGMGTTGKSTGVHLHYEIRIGGKQINPINYLKAANDVF